MKNPKYRREDGMKNEGKSGKLDPKKNFSGAEKGPKKGKNEGETAGPSRRKSESFDKKGGPERPSRPANSAGKAGRPVTGRADGKGKRKSEKPEGNVSFSRERSDPPSYRGKKEDSEGSFDRRKTTDSTFSEYRNRSSGERSVRNKNEKPFARSRPERNSEEKPFARRKTDTDSEEKSFARSRPERNSEEKPFARRKTDTNSEEKSFARSRPERNSEEKPFARRKSEGDSAGKEGPGRGQRTEPGSFSRNKPDRKEDKPHSDSKTTNRGVSKPRVNSSSEFKPKIQEEEEDFSYLGKDYDPSFKAPKKDKSKSYGRPYTKELGTFKKEKPASAKPAAKSSATSRPKSEKAAALKKGDRDSKTGNKERISKSTSFDAIRLNKYIANSGLCARRKADELIAKREITVNGQVITEMGYQVQYGDKVQHQSKTLKPEENVYILLNKPKDYITTTEDPQERRIVMELLDGASKHRIYPVGRLDRNTTGLLLFTNDGELAEKLSHPSRNVEKLYHATLDKALSKTDMEKIAEGTELEDGLIEVDEIAYVEGLSHKDVGVKIHSGKNRIVRRIFESYGYDVIKLDRVLYAGLSKKDLTRGRWRNLTQKEVISLKHFLK